MSHRGRRKNLLTKAFLGSDVLLQGKDSAYQYLAGSHRPFSLAHTSCLVGGGSYDFGSKRDVQNDVDTY